MQIHSANVRLLLDEIHAAYLQIPHFAHFLKGDYAGAARFPDKSRAALLASKKTRAAFVEKFGAVRAEEGLPSYDRLAVDLAAYFVDYMMFPITPLLEPYYDLPLAITPYELLLDGMWESLPLFDCSTPENVLKHIALAADFPRYTREVRDRVYEQAERGIYLFADVIPSTCDALERYATLDYDHHPFSMRRTGSAATEAQMTVERGYIEEANRYYLDIVAFLQSEVYQQKAPKDPGWGQFECGREYYRFMRQFNLGYDLPAVDLHQLGLELLARANEQQAAIRRRLGFDGDHAAFIRQLRGNERFFPSTPERLGELMTGIKDRLAAGIEPWFNERIETQCSVRRLDPEIEKSVTFGFFQPSYDKAIDGVYFYNAFDLEDKCQITSPALLAHELYPGHHFQQSYHAENQDMHPLIRAIVAPAYLEGWAEYSAALMTETGLFDDYDEYGRLENDKFGCVRLIVDTGLNELGWSMAQARQFMVENSFATPQMAVSETLRYACSLPAQCLPYKYGSLKLLELRERFKAARGEKYDVRQFHSLVLDAGCIPLPLLQDYLERETALL